jgi:hypothetical protein
LEALVLTWVSIMKNMSSSQGKGEEKWKLEFNLGEKTSLILSFLPYSDCVLFSSCLLISSTVGVKLGASYTQFGNFQDNWMCWRFCPQKQGRANQKVKAISQSLANLQPQLWIPISNLMQNYFKVYNLVWNYVEKKHWI